MSQELLYKEEVYQIVGAAMEVYNELGAGFLESIYHEALEREFQVRGIPYRRNWRVRVYYKGEVLRTYHVADFICFDGIVLELKANSSLTVEDERQTLNYLRGTHYKLGVLINFGDPGELKYRRIAS